MGLEVNYSTLTANIQLLLYVPHVGTLFKQSSHISKEVRVIISKKVQTITEEFFLLYNNNKK